MRKVYTLLIVVILAVGSWGQSPQPVSNATRMDKVFDGKWWLRADAQERSGFINGAADCLTWTAHESGFNATPEQVGGKISKFYKMHPEAASLTVVDAWEKIAPRPESTMTTETQGETWKNAHWYLNSNWWGQISRSEGKGYLEGYLWCIDNRVVPKLETYSQSVSFYQKSIDAYVEAHPKSGNEAVAVILRRYRDKAPSR